MSLSLGHVDDAIDAHVFPLVTDTADLRIRSHAALRRATDATVALVLLLVALPVIAVVALAVRLDSPGPVFFRQRRVGRDGATFAMFKLRSMVDGAHGMRGVLEPFNEATGGLFKLTYDPRITRVGAVIRRLHLDELPQLWNVLRGDMTLVGPRPLVPEEDAQIPARYAARRRITPGITGPWQVGEGHRVGLAEMAELDLRYAQEWTLFADVAVLARTVRHVLFARGL